MCLTKLQQSPSFLQFLGSILRFLLRYLQNQVLIFQFPAEKLQNTPVLLQFTPILLQKSLVKLQKSRLVLQKIAVTPPLSTRREGRAVHIFMEKCTTMMLHFSYICVFNVEDKEKKSA